MHRRVRVSGNIPRRIHTKGQKVSNPVVSELRKKPTDEGRAVTALAEVQASNRRRRAEQQVRLAPLHALMAVLTGRKPPMVRLPLHSRK